MIRKAETADIPAVVSIYDRILAQECAGQASTGWQPGIYPVEATARAALTRGDLYVYDDGTVRAAHILNSIQADAYRGAPWTRPAADSEVMVMHTLVVDPASFGRGIGRAMVDFYEEYARQQGCTVLRMDTNARNTAARAMYGKLGYREIAIVPCVFNGIPDVQLVLLEKLL